MFCSACSATDCGSSSSTPSLKAPCAIWRGSPFATGCAAGLAAARPAPASRVSTSLAPQRCAILPPSRPNPAVVAPDRPASPACLPASRPSGDSCRICSAADPAPTMPSPKAPARAGPTRPARAGTARPASISPRPIRPPANICGSASPTAEAITLGFCSAAATLPVTPSACWYWRCASLVASECQSLAFSRQSLKRRPSPSAARPERPPVAKSVRPIPASAAPINPLTAVAPMSCAQPFRPRSGGGASARKRLISDSGCAALAGGAAGGVAGCGVAACSAPAPALAASRRLSSSSRKSLICPMRRIVASASAQRKPQTGQRPPP